MMKNLPEQHAFVLDFIKRHKIMSLSTINNSGRPQSAVVGFGESPELNLVFGTYNTSRKYANLERNSAVSIVIGWDEFKTVQYEGVASEITGEEAERYKQLYFAKNPAVRRFETHPEERYFKVVPTWVRYTDLNQEPWDIIELTFYK